MATPVLKSARLISAYRRYLLSADTPQFSSEVGRFYSSSTLNRLLLVGGTEMRRAAALALGVLGDGDSLEPLGRRLSDHDRGVRLAADDAFRGLLIRDAAPTHQHQLLQVMHLNDGGEFAAALAPALILADQAPHYAEALHQLAVCWMGLGDLLAAEDAYRACLWRCRFHYAAWVGLGHSYLQVEEPLDEDLSRGLMALNRALAICPDLEAARLEIRRVERTLEAGWDDFDSECGDGLNEVGGSDWELGDWESDDDFGGDFGGENGGEPPE